MKRIATGIATALLLFGAAIAQDVHAQTEAASHSVTITVEENVSLSLEDGPTLTLEQGESTTAETAYAVHANHQTARTIQASINEDNNLPEGIELSVEMEEPEGSGDTTGQQSLVEEEENVTLIENLTRANDPDLTLTYEADVDATVVPDEFEVEVTYMIMEE